MVGLRVVTLALVLWQSLWIGVAWAQTDADAKKDTPLDPSGTWKWQYQFGDNTMDAKLKLNWDGKKLTGKYTARDATSDIHEAKLDKDEVSFATTREINGNEFDIEFAGKVQKDGIDGTVTIDFGGEPREFEWKAKRAVEIDDVVGVWNLRLETPNGVIEPRLTITKAAEDKLQGTYVSVFGEREPKGLKLKDNQLSWKLSSGDDDEFNFEIVYKGKPRGNQIEGTNEFDFDGNTGTAKFTGKRTPPTEKQEVPPANSKPAESASRAKEAQPATDAIEAEPATPATTDSPSQQ